MRRRTLGYFTAAAVLAALLPFPAAAALPQTVNSVTLPDPSFGDVVVNDATKHVYVTSGGAYSALRVYTYSGTLVKTITQQFGADGMALSADKTRLYVALWNASAVSAIDTDALTEVNRWATPGYNPVSVTLAGARLWIGASASSGTGALLSVDPADPAAQPRTDVTGLSGDPLIAAGGNKVAALAPGLSPASLKVFDVSGGTVQSTISRHDTNASNGQDLVVSPDGSSVLLAAGYPYHIQAFSTSDLSNQASYPTGTYPRAVAISGDSQTVLTGTDASAPDLRIWDSLGAQPRATQHPGPITGGGLATNWDGSVIAVVTRGNNFSFVLRVYSPNTASSISVQAHAELPMIDEPIGISGTLTQAGQPLAGRELAVQRTDPTGTTDLLGVTTDAEGAFSFTDTPEVSGAHTYGVSFAGDETADASTNTVPVTVQKRPVELTMPRLASPVLAGSKVQLSVTLAGTSGEVALFATAAGWGASQQIATGFVDDGGSLTAQYTVRRNMSFVARYEGSSTHQPAAFSRPIKARPIVNTALRRYTDVRKRDDGSNVYVYRRGVVPVVRGNVAPAHPDACLTMRLQSWDGVAWTAGKAWCARIEWDGTFVTQFPVALRPGRRYRIRGTLAEHLDHTTGFSTLRYLRLKP